MWLLKNLTLGLETEAEDFDDALQSVVEEGHTALVHWVFENTQGALVAVGRDIAFNLPFGLSETEAARYAGNPDAAIELRPDLAGPGPASPFETGGELWPYWADVRPAD